MKPFLFLNQILLILFIFGISGINNNYTGKNLKSATVLDIDPDCTCKGFKMYGKIQVVTSFPDVKVQVVESFPDLKVKLVNSFPDDCGEWQFVESFPDTKIQFVESFPDIKIKFVTSFPGIN